MKFIKAFLAVVVWLGVALVIDRLLLSVWCPVCASVLTLALKFKLPGAELAYPSVSLLLLFLIPMIALALYLVPWRAFRSSAAWRYAFSSWCRPWLWMLCLPVLAVAGQALFILTRGLLPDGVTKLAEEFSLAVTISVGVLDFKGTPPLVLTASLAGFLGLLVGAYLFFRNGFKDLFK